MSEQTIYTWRQQERIDRGLVPGLISVEREEFAAAASLRTGLLLALATRAPGAIDDFGSDLDHLLARHLAARLRAEARQVILSTRLDYVVTAFDPEELVRLRLAPPRRASRGVAITVGTARASARFYTTQLVPALSASAVIVVDGHHDRLGLDALASRLAALGRLGSLPAAGVTFVDADGTSNVASLAAAAHALGIYTLALTAQFLERTDMLKELAFTQTDWVRTENAGAVLAVIESRVEPWRTKPHDWPVAMEYETARRADLRAIAETFHGWSKAGAISSAEAW